MDDNALMMQALMGHPVLTMNPGPAVMGQHPGMMKVPKVSDYDTATHYQTPEANQAQSLTNIQRMNYPGIWKDPRDIADEAGAQTAAEDPAMKAIFGVTRDDLYNMSQQGTRPGNMPGSYKMPNNPKGSYVTDALMTPANAQRLIDANAEAMKYPDLQRGMDAWYVMDPAYHMLEREYGPDQAKQLYNRFNTVTAMHSPSSDVNTELNRGTAANMMINQGKWPQWMRFGGTEGGGGLPELADVRGHPHHSTAQSGPVGRYLQSGEVNMTKPKVPLYMQASGVPETGFQTNLPVPDSHFMRAVGAADVRTTNKPGTSAAGPDYHALGPWFRENVAGPLGIQAVPAQARTWGVFAPQTGVDTPIGAPKLEILSGRVMNRANKLGVDPKRLMIDVLSGKNHAQLEGGPQAA